MNERKKLFLGNGEWTVREANNLSTICELQASMACYRHSFALLSFTYRKDMRKEYPVTSQLLAVNSSYVTGLWLHIKSSGLCKNLAITYSKQKFEGMGSHYTILC
jgi:hypothetical protein